MLLRKWTPRASRSVVKLSSGTWTGSAWGRRRRSFLPRRPWCKVPRSDPGSSRSDSRLSSCNWPTAARPSRTWACWAPARPWVVKSTVIMVQVVVAMWSVWPPWIKAIRVRIRRLNWQEQLKIEKECVERILWVDYNHRRICVCAEAGW